MADGAAILRLVTWFSPAFPTGAYAYSHGLEWAVEAGDITDAATLGSWIEDVLLFGSGRSDAILLRHAHRAALTKTGTLGTSDVIPRTPFAEVAELAEAMTPSRERRAETVSLGAAFAAAAAAWDTLKPAPYPVAVGALTGRSEIAEGDAAHAYVQAFALNLVSAGVRLVPLGQSAGLAILAALEPTILSVVSETKNESVDDLGGACWRSDIATMRHETQYTRLFRT